MMNETSTYTATPHHRLYSIKQIVFASWAASPIAGFVLLHFNYRALQKLHAAWQSLAWGLFVTVAWFAIPLSRFYKLPRMVLPFAGASAMWLVASYLQGDTLRSHFAAGGRRGSWWITVSLSVGIVVCIFTVLFVGLMLYQYIACYYQCR